MTINNKSERNYQGKCLGWPVTSYGGEEWTGNVESCKKEIKIKGSSSLNINFSPKKPFLEHEDSTTLTIYRLYLKTILL